MKPRLIDFGSKRIFMPFYLFRDHTSNKHHTGEFRDRFFSKKKLIVDSLHHVFFISLNCHTDGMKKICEEHGDYMKWPFVTSWVYTQVI